MLQKRKREGERRGGDQEGADGRRSPCNNFTNRCATTNKHAIQRNDHRSDDDEDDDDGQMNPESTMNIDQ